MNGKSAVLIANSMQLEMALSVLRASVKSDEVMFWGKVTGVNEDYYIAVTVTYQGMYEFPTKCFYYTLSNTPNYQFREMPALGLPDLEQNLLIDTSDSLFLGQPAKILGNNVEGEEGEEEPPKEEEPEEDDDGTLKAKNSDDSEEEEIKVPKKTLTELDRLTTVVLAIENDC